MVKSLIHYNLAHFTTLLTNGLSKFKTVLTANTRVRFYQLSALVMNL